MHGWGRIHKCVENKSIEGRIVKAAGAVFFGIGLLVLMSLSWKMYNISHGFLNLLLGYMKKAGMDSRGLGQLSATILGGSLLCVPHADLLRCTVDLVTDLREPTAMCLVSFSLPLSC